MAKVGRNDPCPCGSGKKYKHCHGRDGTSAVLRWEQSSRRLLEGDPRGAEIVRTCFAVLRLIQQKHWQGACHATTGVLHVLLLAQGVESRPCVGEARTPAFFFDHSWIEIDGAPYDMAVALPLDPSPPMPPVVKGVDVETGTPTVIQYGVRSGIGDYAPATFVKSMSFVGYMDGFPDHRHGLWDVAADLGATLGLRLQVAQMRSAHADTSWLIRQSG